jgi:peptide/nickel transport system substrate-binding protein
MFKKQVRTLRLSLAVLFVSLAACAPPLAPTPTPEPKGGGGEFRVVLAAEPTSLNPNLRADDAAFNACQNFYNKLVTLDADYRVIPDLATRWDISAEGLTYTFYLAKNVKWHDGQPFTSADVKWTFETIAREKGFAQGLANRIVSIETPDATTAIMRLKESYAPFVPSLAWYGTFILPQHIFEGSDWTKNPANEKPVGTGPFKFVEWVKGDHITAIANKDYFKRGPFLDQVTWRFPKVAPLGPDLVVKGDADYTQATPPRERVAELLKTPGVQVKTYASTNRYYLGINVRRKPLDDVRVRQAINMAVDRSVILSRAFAGLGTPGVGFYTPGIPWAYNPNAQAPAFDVAGAEKLLDDAGVKRGADNIRFKPVLVAVNASPFKETAQIVQEQLRVVGIEINLALLAAAELDKRTYLDKDFDLWLNDGAFGPDPENLNVRFGTTGSTAVLGYTSAEFDAAMAEGGRLANVADRARAYFRAQEILARDLPLAPLVDTAVIVQSRDNVTGLGYVEARGLVTFQDYSLVRVKR